ncbi:LexA family protein [Truepera radiovictrix]|uniref:Transcriptional repressor, LexA family n=1 Tax=Truepera radiovictrix (strain DSM 17093 / CIP 108686 / LMG 22925 / RQ-24) TaxID=649638 RepID=D7CRI0_TRURR|nr:S24 family peptidase [Truepera radiovictrix]ADI13470.1 transcriptional repressor, LexA family [Truepera radiovictrix DSM 17093]WMT57969.1 S24 family peptidase [Truepera radiovictrix]
MNELPKMQRKVYERLCEYKERTGRSPELSVFARDLNIHYVSLRQHLEALHRKGYVIFESRGRGQSPRLELPARATGVPVLGSIPAGPLSEALAEPEGFLPLTGARQQFALRVSGDSMADLIQDGDIVLFRKGMPTRSGEICAVRVGNSEVTLKYVDHHEPQTVTLRPHNPQYPTVAVPATEVHIEGVYLGLVRGELIGALYEAL